MWKTFNPDLDAQLKIRRGCPILFTDLSKELQDKLHQELWRKHNLKALKALEDKLPVVVGYCIFIEGHMVEVLDGPIYQDSQRGK
jgi:hypothetical protein